MKMKNQTLSQRILGKILLTIIWMLGFTTMWASPILNDSQKILVIASTNPDNPRMLTYLSTFIEEYAVLGGRNHIVVESLNSQDLSSIFTWEDNLRGIIDKQFKQEEPVMIVILGQEAWATYLQMNDEWTQRIPVISAQVGRHIVEFPNEGADIKQWIPYSYESFKDFSSHKIVGSIANNYDIESNIELIRKLYPDTHHIAFLSDNSYSGVTMQAIVKKELRKNAELELITLDGRQESFLDINRKIANLPDNTCILVGTWRIDNTGNNYMGNTTYMFNQTAERIPAFTLTTSGLGNWVIGGYTPDYHNIGYELAKMVFRYLDAGYDSETNITYIDNKYIFDYEQLKKFNISSNVLPPESTQVNAPPSFYEEYKGLVYTTLAIMTILVLVLIFISLYALHFRRLRDSLAESKEELIIAREKAEEANRLKSAFLANMSHEIRTPLNSIVGFSEILVSGDFPENEKKEFCNLIKKNTDVLLQLISDILDISRIEAGHMKMNFQNYDVISIARETMMVMSESHKTNAELKIVTDLDAYVLRTDAQRLQQIIMNLLTNAAKFTLEGSITLTIEINKEDNNIIFSVADTGCGIPDDKIEKVFERFEKLDKYTQGTGLGLPITRLLVEKMGGKIWVDSTYKDGAKFIFTLPI